MSPTVQHLSHLRQPPSSPGSSRPLRVVIAHDWLCGLRGGEHVLDAIIRHGVSLGWDLPALLVMFDNQHPHTPAIDSLRKIVSPLGRIPILSNRLRREFFPLYPLAIASLSARLTALHEQSPIDLVISTSSAAIKGLEMPRGSSCKHLCYIHAPARYAWSLQEQYSQGSLLRRIGLSLTTPAFRAWDLKTSANVHHFMANAHYTAAQVHRCYSREASVLYPPVRTEMFIPPSPSATKREEFWLAVSALEPYKRIDIAIAAANRLQHPLIIAGTGSQMSKLQAMAGPTVRFMGRVDDKTLIDLYQRARMLIFPQIEDFGIVAVEAQACGLPVLAYKDGGALDTVIDDVTGAFFESQDPDTLIEAARRVPTGSDQACRENALRFSYLAFEKGLDDQITLALNA